MKGMNGVASDLGFCCFEKDTRICTFSVSKTKKNIFYWCSIEAVFAGGNVMIVVSLCIELVEGYVGLFWLNSFFFTCRG